MKLKRLIIAAAIGAAGLQFPATQAATSTGIFDVNITLTSACTLGSIAAVVFAYTSLGGAQPSTGGGFNVTCTGSLPYSFGLLAGATPTPGAGTPTLNVTDDVVNLAYTLTAPAGGNGTGLPVGLTITGNMIAGQAGTCATASCTNALATNKTQTLVVTF
jgi:spore coat protein U-like protein